MKFFLICCTICYFMCRKNIFHRHRYLAKWFLSFVHLYYFPGLLLPCRHMLQVGSITPQIGLALHFPAPGPPHFYIFGCRKTEWWTIKSHLHAIFINIWLERPIAFQYASQISGALNVGRYIYLIWIIMLYIFALMFLFIKYIKFCVMQL